MSAVVTRRDEFGRPLAYLGAGGSWVDDPRHAERMPDCEAERLASDWRDYAASKGYGDLYSADPVAGCSAVAVVGLLLLGGCLA